MARVNTCLKHTFTFFNVFFAIIGGLIIKAALLSQIYANDQAAQELASRSSSFVVLCILGGITMAIAILGACGAHRESKVCLVLFLVCMVIGTLLMLPAGVFTASLRPAVMRIMEESARKDLPLDQASEEVKTQIEQQQKDLHCCGLFSYKDWEDNIPDSCLCNHDDEKWRCEQVRYRGFMQRSVYSQGCFPIITGHFLWIIDIAIGIYLTLAMLALLGMILSSIIIHQMSHPDRPAVVMSVPAVLTAPPLPKYHELQNPPAYS